MSKQAKWDPAWRRAREYMGVDLDQAEYARILGVKAQNVSQWEKGSGLSRGTVEMIAQKLDLSAHYLLFGEEYQDNGPPRPSIAAQLQKLMEWVRGEAVEWEPDTVKGRAGGEPAGNGKPTKEKDGGGGQ